MTESTNRQEIINKAQGACERIFKANLEVAKHHSSSTTIEAQETINRCMLLYGHILYTDSTYTTQADSNELAANDAVSTEYLQECLESVERTLGIINGELDKLTDRDMADMLNKDGRRAELVYEAIIKGSNVGDKYFIEYKNSGCEDNKEIANMVHEYFDTYGEKIVDDDIIYDMSITNRFLQHSIDAATKVIEAIDSELKRADSKKA